MTTSTWVSRTSFEARGLNFCSASLTTSRCSREPGTCWISGVGAGSFWRCSPSQGTTAKGIDMNQAMVDACREQGLQVETADAVTYLSGLPSASLGGLIATQVVEHLQPPYLSRLLDLAFDKLKPGAPLVLETINPTCWVAFFESYLRDLTHAQPVHPDTLKYLLVATGFQRVDIQFRAPFPDELKLERVHLEASSDAAAMLDAVNANFDRLNRLIYGYLDYAVVGYRP